MLSICCWILGVASGLSLQAFGSMSSKKRKQPDVDTLEHERTMHGSFVSAANSISQLYTQAIHQQRRAQIEGARAALVGSFCAPLVAAMHSTAGQSQGPYGAWTALE